MENDFNSLLHKFRDKKKKERENLRAEQKNIIKEPIISRKIDSITWKEVYTTQNYINCLICYKEFQDDDIRIE